VCSHLEAEVGCRRGGCHSCSSPVHHKQLVASLGNGDKEQRRKRSRREGWREGRKGRREGGERKGEWKEGEKEGGRMGGGGGGGGGRGHIKRFKNIVHCMCLALTEWQDAIELSFMFQRLQVHISARSSPIKS